MQRDSSITQILLEIAKDALLLLSERERVRLIFIAILVFISSISEVIGVASIIPFLTIAMSPMAVTESPYLKWFYERSGFSDPTGLTLFLGIGAIIVFVVSTVINVLSMWIVTRWTYLREYSIGKRLFRHYLYKPYDFFLKRHSTEFSKNIFTEIALVINGVFIPGIFLLTKAITALIIVVFLLVYNVTITSSLLLIFGGVYILIFLGLNRLLIVWGTKRVEVNDARFKVATETFGGIKEVLLYAKQGFFLRSFKKPSQEFAELQSLQNIVGMLPRYVLELLAFGGALLSIVILILMGGNLRHFVPLMMLYTIAGYRLLPALQAVYANATKISFNRASLKHLADELKDIHTTLDSPSFEPHGEYISFCQGVFLTDAVFFFEGCEEPTLQDINLWIRPGEKIGLVGETGCGKTTTVNLLVGLLIPTFGKLMVDGRVIKGATMIQWQRKIGYVTQHVFLSGTSIRQNIAFGDEEGEVDFEEVKRVCRIAQIHDFIENELPFGYNTLVGERGVRLSGGQIQRIGIARALYRKPELLVMDEATNALDTLTEVRLYEGIYSSLGNVAIVIIAHRISALKKCDRLYFFQKGRIVDQGTYQELFQRRRDFQELAIRGDVGESKSGGESGSAYTP